MPFKFNPFTRKLDITDTGSSSSPSLFVYQSPTIDFTQAGLTTIVLTSSSVFVPTQYTMYCVSAVSPNSDSVFSIGYTAPDYDDLVANLNFSLTTAGEFQTFTNFGGPKIAVPSASSIKVNVSSIDTGTTLTGKVILLGYYL